jgi:hypothetical protein
VCIRQVTGANICTGITTITANRVSLIAFQFPYLKLYKKKYVLDIVDSGRLNSCTFASHLDVTLSVLSLEDDYTVCCLNISQLSKHCCSIGSVSSFVTFISNTIPLNICAVETVSLNSLRLKYIIIQDLYDFWTFGSYTAG